MKNFILLCLFIALPGFTQSMSLIVMQAKDGQVLYSEAPMEPMTPASTTKLLTAYTALHQLGPAFRFETQAFQAGNTLYIKFSGDPSLTSPDLKVLLTEALAKIPSKETVASLVIDHSAFGSPWVARGWGVDDVVWYYAAPVHAVILDENTLPLKLVPPKALGERVQITSANPAIQITSRVTAVSEETADKLCELEVSLPRPQVIDFDGCWPVNVPLQTLNLANAFPLETAQALIKSTLATQGVTLKGKITSGKVPNQATLLATHSSAPLSSLVKPILQDSNNLYAEALAKTLGAQAYQRGTFQAGSYFIENSIKAQLQLEPGELSLVDGSGLSSLNLISANTLAQLLLHAYQDQQVGPLFMDALAVSGTNGTLKQRFKTFEIPFVGKTGSITHVSTLAGYYGLSTDNPLIFVMMVNNATDKSAALKKMEERVILQTISPVLKSQ